MKVQVLSLSLAALAALAATSSPGIAGGDWTEAGISNYNASVAVPAPIPVPINAAQWYIRIDGGWAAGASGDVTAEGVAVDAFDFDSGDSFFSWGIGIGYYVTRNFRVELAGDWATKATTSRWSEGITDDIGPVVGPTTGGDESQDILHYAGVFNHKTTLDSSAALFNLIYDLDTGTFFKPYVGGGLGLSVHNLRVVGDSNMSCVNLDRTYADTNGDGVTPAVANPMPCAQPDSAARNSNTITTYGLAATLMAGFGIEVYDGVHWDNGYQLIYRGGSPSISYHTPTAEGTIRIEDRVDHEIRTGVRFDIF